MKRLTLLVLSVWLIASWQAFAQEKTIQGTVVDAASNEALPGVAVLIKGTTKGTLTDIKGNYSISINIPGSVLMFSFVGYLTEEILVTDQVNINISLVPEVKNIDEVVVIGYGTVKKKDATGAVNTVSASNFNKGSIGSPENLIAGKAAGVIITSASGAPGMNSQIRVRGSASINANNEPLIVIDGVPLDNKISGMPGAINSVNGLATINPNDIETFTILKDASATAIYGSRASGGVILITTKRGSKKFKVNYNTNLSLNAMPEKVKALNADEWLSAYQEQIRRHPNDSQFLALRGNANTDWQSEIYQPAFSQDHNLSVSGTAGKTPYRASLGYTNQNGTLINTYFKRTTLALGADPSLFKDHLKINLNLKGMYIDNGFSDASAISDAVNYDPSQSVYNETGYWRGYTTWTHNDGSGVNLATPNPVAKAELTDAGSIVKRSIGNAQFDYKFHFLPDLHANLNLAYDYSKTDGQNNVPDSTQWVYNPAPGNGRYQIYTQERKNELLDFYLNYNKNIEVIKSNIDLMGGYSWSHFWKENVDSIYTADKSVFVNGTVAPTEYYLISFFGRLNYSLMDKYLLTFTVRDDGTSRFSPESRWGLFPSAAFAWKINNENFIKNIKVISDLKLRIGYGVTGQQDLNQGSGGVTDYPYIKTFTISTIDARYKLGNQYNYTLRPNWYNSMLKWETTTTSNIGIDFGFYNNRITGTFDYYLRNTKDLLLQVAPPVLANFTNSLLSNVGTSENKGFEFTMNTKILSKKDLSWQLSFNLGYNQNKITSLTLVKDEDAYIDAGPVISGTIGDFIQVNKVGYPQNSFYVYQQKYDSMGKPIEGSYVDRNNDSLVNASDLYVYKNPNPDVVMGISSYLNYKNWDFSFAGRINLGNYVYNNIAANSTYSKMHSTLGYLSNNTEYVNEAQFSNTQYHSDYYVQKASFFKMDNISLGYRFSNIMEGKINLHASLAVQNVFDITKYKGLDPEISNGMDNNFYPRSRIFLFALSLEL